MPGRIIPLINGEYYHIFNRGSDKRNIFAQTRDYKRLMQLVYYYQFIGPKISFSKFAKSDLNLFKPDPNKKLVEIICYCLMPNHFHLLIRQLKENGISIFLSQISNSYTKYFNTKYSRVGALMQGTFKAVLIESDEQLIHLSRYIHINPVVAGIVKNLDNYPWSSYKEYMQTQGVLCSTTEVLNLFPSQEKYKEFLEDQIEYGETLEHMKHHLLDVKD